jgi:response regulator RpfG family c-di-GMP phosphodiesterase
MHDQTVLVVDSEEENRLSLTLLSRREGYRTLTAVTAKEAIGHLEHERVAVVITEQCLPGLTGIEFLRSARERWPDTVRILLTSYSDTTIAIASINEAHVYRYMTKPWNRTEMQSVIRDSVRFHELQRDSRRLYELTVSQALQLRTLNEELQAKVARHTTEIENKNSEIEDHLLDMLRLLVSVQEMRQFAADGNSQRMGEAARWLAQDLGLSAAEQRDVEIAATLHDVGKVSLPDRVLHQETPSLAREDQELLRQAALRGEGLLSTIPRLGAAARLVRHQGEWYNGQGYPDGLSGEAIPIGSRIIAVVSGYLQLGENRENLLQNTGHRYDPRIVQEFIRYLDEKQQAARGGVELPVAPTDLREGMVLTRDLYTARGLLVATTGKVVDQPTLNKIHDFSRVDSIAGRVVYVHA